MIPRILVLANQKSENYIGAIEKCHGIASIDYNEPLDSFDGLLLCGGNDIHPSYYGQEIDGACDFDQARDAREFKILKAFLDTGKPILGICRGMQLLNVALGGTLIQDLSNAHFHRSHNGQDSIHLINANGALEKMYGNTFFVNSSHHQAVDVLGSGLEMCGWCDGVIEAFEHKEKPYFAVQFHPERMYESDGASDGIKIFDHFIKLCK
jgi:putative glutamine amidotransferase